MFNFIVSDRKTDYLVPPSLDDWLHEDHLARFIVEVVDQLDVSKSFARRNYGPRSGFRVRQAARCAHSAVESAINALEVHGLDVCPDHGIEGFRRYVALAVLARNIHRIRILVWQQDQAGRCKYQGQPGRQTNRRKPHTLQLVPVPAT